jgi:hypothetical protein
MGIARSRYPGARGEGGTLSLRPLEAWRLRDARLAAPENPRMGSWGSGCTVPNVSWVVEERPRSAVPQPLTLELLDRMF